MLVVVEVEHMCHQVVWWTGGGGGWNWYSGSTAGTANTGGGGGGGCTWCMVDRRFRYSNNKVQISIGKL